MATTKKTTKEAEVVKTKAKKVSTKDIKKDVKAVGKSIANTTKDLRALGEAELHNALATAKADLVEAQKMLHANELPSAHVIRKSKKLIARIHTVLTEVTNSKEEK
ncbi:MAG TPA: 50S ribosomal protein L29 [Candidatus Nanoperiomorbaceae bacterium]|jgi:ribosomal protein L29|nr:MAG: 50S ribosomal protein L29 [Candidatus Saccharibacteria bacterium]HMQ09375.1 50S ribosomal protein L29 [Candidatus Nanoperiomorbaceae bacterium]HMQ96919.1 50S ribosomal protein L29 [Candidatus Nanoperiomorbaceae bacterium]HMR86251.1 50S ribosomal protein L29 [Candidatus Nanoperiomorbaceae bacterium]HMU12007.1 50S ribosomal protein L29 [Candidatus Nanoperiomorbaceae bacterium]